MPIIATSLMADSFHCINITIGQKYQGLFSFLLPVSLQLSKVRHLILGNELYTSPLDESTEKFLYQPPALSLLLLWTRIPVSRLQTLKKETGGIPKSLLRTEMLCRISWPARCYA